MGDWRFDDDHGVSTDLADAALEGVARAVEDEPMVPMVRLTESLMAMRMGVKVLAKDPKKFHPEFVMGYKAAIRTFEDLLGWDRHEPEEARPDAG